MRVLGEIIENVTGSPIVRALARVGREDIEGIQEALRKVTDLGEKQPAEAPILPQALADWSAPVKPPAWQTIVGVSSEGSGIGASLPTPQKFIIDDVLFQVVTSETLEEEVDIPEHPVEDRQMVADHTWRHPTVLRVRGSLIGYPVMTERHKRALEKLQRLKHEGLPVTVVCDFPPGELEDMVIRRFSVTREYPWRNEYLIDIELRKVEYVDSAGGSMEAVAAPDPAAPAGVAIMPEGTPQNGGMQMPSPQKAPADDVFGGLFEAVRHGLEQLSTSQLGKLALDWGKDMIRNAVPGAGLVMDALSGDLGVRSLLETAASFIPGGAALLNTMFAAIDVAQGAVFTIGGLGSFVEMPTPLENVVLNALTHLTRLAARSNPALGGIERLEAAALSMI